MIDGQFLPKRIFVDQLPTGLFDLSCYFIIPEDSDCDSDSIDWKIMDDTEDEILYSKSSSPSNVFHLAAVLPPTFNGGLLEVRVSCNGDSHCFEERIEINNQQTDFILPLSGRALLVVGHRLGEVHRSALQIPSQQFAWDFLGLADDTLGIVSIDQTKTLTASDFPGFGMEVIAPANGVIIEARDGTDDVETIGQLPEDMSYFLEDLTIALGNYVIIKHTESAWSVLAHLKKDSLLVEVGKDVKQGEPVGELGNSGFTSGPHLHFHVMDGPDILSASPLPVILSLEEGAYSPQAGEIVSNA